MTKLTAIALLVTLATPAIAAEYPLQCGRVQCDAHDGVMSKEGKFVLVMVNPSRFRFTYACWRTFDTLAEARAAERKASGVKP
jgi:hypothetical protein